MKYGRIRTCKCGTRFRERVYPCGDRHSVWCRKCAKKRQNAYLSVRDRHRECDQCGRRYRVRRGTIYVARWAGHGANCGRAECRAKAVERVYPENPRGIRFCKAPVPGGCQRPRGRKGAAGGMKPFCQGHEKRRDRGRPIDTPINERMSRQRKAARRRYEESRRD